MGSQAPADARAHKGTEAGGRVGTGGAATATTAGGAMEQDAGLVGGGESGGGEGVCGGEAGNDMEDWKESIRNTLRVRALASSTPTQTSGTTTGCRGGVAVGGRLGGGLGRSQVGIVFFEIRDGPPAEDLGDVKEGARGDLGGVGVPGAESCGPGKSTRRSGGEWKGDAESH